MLFSFKNVGLALGGLLFVGFGIGSGVTAPNNAIVYSDGKAYFAPPCVDPDKLPLPRLPLSVAESIKLTKNQSPCNEHAFWQEGRSFSGLLLQSIGIFPPLRSRWNSDGSWNW